MVYLLSSTFVAKTFRTIIMVLTPANFFGKNIFLQEVAIVELLQSIFPPDCYSCPLNAKQGCCLAIFAVSYIESHDSCCNSKPTVICVIIWTKKVTKTLVLTKMNWKRTCHSLVFVTQRTRKTKWSLTFLQMRTRKLRRASNGVPELLLMQISILTTVPLGLLRKCCQTSQLWIFPYNFHGRCLWSDCHANKPVCNIPMQEALQSKKHPGLISPWMSLKPCLACVKQPSLRDHWDQSSLTRTQVKQKLWSQTYFK